MIVSLGLALGDSWDERGRGAFVMAQHAFYSNLFCNMIFLRGPWTVVALAFRYLIRIGGGGGKHQKAGFYRSFLSCNGCWYYVTGLLVVPNIALLCLSLCVSVVFS